MDRYLAVAGPEMSRSVAGRLLREGHVRVNGAVARPSTSVAVGDILEVDLPDPRPPAATGEDIPLHVVYADRDIVVIDKPAGMVVHPAAGHASGTLVNALLGLGGEWSSAGGVERPGIVHRLDRGTSGLIAVARTDRAHRALAAQLADRTMSRSYLAISKGRIAAPSGVLEGDIGRDPRHRRRMAVVEDGRFARTRFEVLERLTGHTLIRCALDTGRTHQIRVHLAAYGHPLAGDELYGGGREAPRPMLHAHRLRFRHPASGAEIELEAAAPPDFEAFLESVR